MNTSNRRIAHRLSVLVGPSDDWTQLMLSGPIGVGCLGAALLLLAHLPPTKPPSS